MNDITISLNTMTSTELFEFAYAAIQHKWSREVDRAARMERRGLSHKDAYYNANKLAEKMAELRTMVRADTDPDSASPDINDAE